MSGPVPTVRVLRVQLAIAAGSGAGVSLPG